MQTILGATGIIGTELAKELPRYTNRIRLVSRHPKKVNDKDELFTADLLNAGQTMEAVRGSEIVYLVPGLVYSAKVWKEQWPVIMKNTIDACLAAKARLLFFDNVYAYGKVNGTMTEDTPLLAVSKKGTVRIQIIRMLLGAMHDKGLTAMIVRAPEFYGPGKTLSAVNALVFDNIRKGKKAQWLITDQRKRTFIYTPDAARATALLANSSGTWNQTWHLPCADVHPTGKEFMQMISKAAGKEIRSSILTRPMIRMAGIFVPFVREVRELLYQNETDYIFNSDKFKKAFPEFRITPYKEGIRQILEETDPK